jgi:hypothetical protein
MIRQVEVALKSKLEQAYRLALVHWGGKWHKIVLVVEYPKSGGTWLSQLVSSYLELPFPRNIFPKLEDNVLHGHYQPSATFHKLNKILWLVRDGRDVMISLYHHYLLWNDKNRINPKDVHYHRSKLPFKDYEDISANLPAFIQYTFEHVPSKMQQFTFMGNWSDYNMKWLNARQEGALPIYMIKYEDLLADTNRTLHIIMKEGFEMSVIDEDKVQEVVNKYSFKTQTKRTEGTENKQSFLRKGISGDWKNYFTPEAASVFDQYAGEVLVALGYEKDRSWVTKLAKQHEDPASS